MPVSSAEGRRQGGRPNAAARLAIDQRRAQVSALVRSGLSYRRIAALMDVSHNTILNDVQTLRARYRAQATADYLEHVADAMQTLDVLTAAWMPAALRGDKDAAAIVLRIEDRKARLLGSDAPTRTEAQITVATTSALDAEIETLLAQMRAEYDAA